MRVSSLAPAVLATLLAAGTLIACGGEDADNAGDDITPPPLVTEVSTVSAGETAQIEGEPIVSDRTLPADALSAERLEAVGDATTGGGATVTLARAASPDVAEWEYVSPAEEGWLVWQPQIVRDVLADAGSGAKLEQVERVSWPNACLGAAEPDEACAEVITPGYRVLVRIADGTLVDYHTDLASRWRIAPSN